MIICLRCLTRAKLLSSGGASIAIFYHLICELKMTCHLYRPKLSNIILVRHAVKCKSEPMPLHDV